MKLILALILGLALAINLAGNASGTASPAFFNNLFQSMGLLPRRYKHGTYIPLNGQKMPRKPLSRADKERKTMKGVIGSISRRSCSEGYIRSRTGKCIAAFRW